MSLVAEQGVTTARPSWHVEHCAHCRSKAPTQPPIWNSEPAAPHVAHVEHTRLVHVEEMPLENQDVCASMAPHPDGELALVHVGKAGSHNRCTLVYAVTYEVTVVAVTPSKPTVQGTVRCNPVPASPRVGPPPVAGLPSPSSEATRRSPHGEPSSACAPEWNHHPAMRKARAGRDATAATAVAVPQVPHASSWDDAAATHAGNSAANAV